MGDDRQDPPDRPGSVPGAGDADRTQHIRPPGEAAGTPGTDNAATARHEPVDRTAPLPPAEQIDQASRPAPWSGRAEVRAPQPADESGPVDWYAGQEQSGRRWWMPIMVGITALLLLGVLGVGVWLIIGSQEDEPALPPLPSLTPSATRLPSPTGPATTATTPPPTTGQPTTDAPTTAAPTTAESLPMPPLVGLTRAGAVAVLDGLGLRHQIRTRESDLPPGTVIATEPGPGAPVPADGEVILVIAVPGAEPTAEPTGTPGDPRSPR